MAATHVASSISRPTLSVASWVIHHDLIGNSERESHSPPVGGWLRCDDRPDGASVLLVLEEDCWKCQLTFS